MHKEKYVFSREDVIKHQNAEFIYINDDIDYEIDLSVFKNVKELRLQCRKFINLGSLEKLDILKIRYLNENNTLEISKLKNLKRINITYGNIKNLDFLSSLKRLEIVDICYLKKLTCINGLQNLKNTLTSVSIETCKKINSLETLKYLTEVKELQLVKVEIKNLDFLHSLKKLEKLLIMELNIESGDLSPALNIPWVSIDNKRHYNYTCDFKQKKLLPKTTKASSPKKRTNTIVLKHFGNINLDDVDNTYEVNIEDAKGNISLDINFESKKIKKELLKATRLILKAELLGIWNDLTNILTENCNNESVVMYKEFLADELEMEFDSFQSFIDSLQLKRIGFYPEDEVSHILFDLQPKEMSIDHVLCIQVNKKLVVSDIVVES